MSSNMSESINTWRGLQYYNIILLLLSDLMKFKLMFKSELKAKRLNDCNYLELDLFYTMTLLQKIKAIKDSIEDIFQKRGIFSEFEKHDKLETEELFLENLEDKPELYNIAKELLSNSLIKSTTYKTNKNSIRQEIEELKTQNLLLIQQKNKILEDVKKAQTALANKVDSL